MSLVKRGAFIVLEGIDRTGKTTQVKLLQDHFSASGVPTVSMRFPDRTTPIGSILDGYLAKGVKVEAHAVHLVFAANRWEARETILKHLSEGITVICDRYAYSGVAFTATKGLDVEWLKNPDRGLPRPDAVLYLDLSIEDAMKRGGFGNEVYEKEDLQRIVKGVYEEKLWEDEYWHKVPANQTPEELHELLKALCTKIIASIPADSKEPKTLWTEKL